MQFTTDPADFPSLPTGATATCPRATSSSDLPNTTYTSLVLNSYSSCAYTLSSGSIYKIQSLTITGGGTLHLNGATLFVDNLTISNDTNSTGVLGAGTIYVNNLTVSKDGYIQSANIKAYKTVTLNLNGDTVGAIFSKFAHGRNGYLSKGHIEFGFTEYYLYFFGLS